MVRLNYTTSDALLHLGRTDPFALGDRAVPERDCNSTSTYYLAAGSGRKRYGLGHILA